MKRLSISDIWNINGDNFVWLFPIVVSIVCLLLILGYPQFPPFVFVLLVTWGAFFLSERLTPSFSVIKLIGLNVFGLFFTHPIFTLISVFIGLITFLEVSVKEYKNNEPLTKYAFKARTLSKHATLIYACFLFFILSFFLAERQGVFIMMIGDETNFFNTGLYVSSCLLLLLPLKFPAKYDSLMISTMPFMTKLSDSLEGWMKRKFEDKFYNDTLGQNDNPKNTPGQQQKEDIEKALSTPSKKSDDMRRRQSAIMRKAEKNKKEKEENDRDYEDIGREKERLEISESRLDVVKEKIDVEKGKVEAEKTRVETEKVRVAIGGDLNELKRQRDAFVTLMEREALKREKEQILYNQRKTALENQLIEIVRAKRDLELTTREKKQYLDAYNNRLKLLKGEIDQSYNYQMKALKMAEKESKMNLQREKDNITDLHRKAQYKLTEATLRKKDIEQYYTGEELSRKASIIRTIEEDWWNSDDFNKIDAYNKQGVRLSSPLISEVEKLRASERNRISESVKPSSFWNKIFGG